MSDPIIPPDDDDARHERIRAEAFKRMALMNERITTTGEALDEIGVTYEILAHLVAGIYTWAGEEPGDAVLNNVVTLLPRFVEQIRSIHPAILNEGTDGKVH